MNHTTHKNLNRRKRRIQRRLARRRCRNQARPILWTTNIHYELADRDLAIGCGGIGMIHLLVRRVGLAHLINLRVPLLKRHLPYFESDHVLSLAYNILAGGMCIEDLELLRNDEGYLNALGETVIVDNYRHTTEPEFNEYNPLDADRRVVHPKTRRNADRTLIRGDGRYTVTRRLHPACLGSER